MLKHVGRHGDRKVVVVFRKIQGEDHMALVTYSDNLPSMVHDEVMKVVESVVGQQAGELADALSRHYMPDGSQCLTALHRGGWLKKVQTKQIILTPNAKTSVRLDEVNNILDKMALGEEAKQQLAEMDAQRGYRDPAKSTREPREVGEPTKTTSASVSGASASPTNVLSDADIAQQRLDQANRMEAEAKGLLAEAKRLKEEAKALTPAKVTAKAKNVRTTKTTKAKV